MNANEEKKCLAYSRSVPENGFVPLSRFFFHSMSDFFLSWDYSFIQKVIKSKKRTKAKPIYRPNSVQYGIFRSNMRNNTNCDDVNGVMTRNKKKNRNNMENRYIVTEEMTATTKLANIKFISLEYNTIDLNTKLKPKSVNCKVVICIVTGSRWFDGLEGPGMRLFQLRSNKSDNKMEIVPMSEDNTIKCEEPVK